MNYWELNTAVVHRKSNVLTVMQPSH